MIVIATCDEYPRGNAATQLLVDALHGAGAQVQTCPWTQEDQQVFVQAEVVLPLCVWDYAHKPQELAQWVRSVPKLQNPADVILENMDKRYLVKLGALGVKVPPTFDMSGHDGAQVACVMRDQGWAEAVLKPACGQGGVGVMRLTPETAQALEDVQDGMLLQPYLADVVTRGETCIYFIGGRFSHAIRRNTAEGDWRANGRFGCTIEAVDVPQVIIARGEEVLRKLPSMPLYARQDGILAEDGFTLTELEMIEPNFYFDTCPQAVDMFARAILEIASH
jgi:hypothetical protein